MDQTLVQERASRSPMLAILAYGLMILLAVAAHWAIDRVGQHLEAPTLEHAARAAAPTAPAGGDTLLRVLVALSAVILAGRLLGAVFTRLGQPPVIGEVMAGILLGPSLLGHEVSGWILPASVAPALSVVAQLGVILYMFLVGLELNGDLLRKRAHSTVAISHASIVAPFLLGGLLALGLYPILSHRDVPFTSFALFMGVAMSITAFPVLARILTDRGIDKTELGVVALSCAATDDVTAWCLLAFVVGVVQADIEGAVWVCVMALLFIAAMLVVVRPLAIRLARRIEGQSISIGVLAVLLAMVLLAALTTEAIGIHAIFGAFLLGAIIPHDSRLARETHDRLHDVVTILLLPAFFALTGMRTQIGLVEGLNEWLLCGLIILTATLGKFGGTVAAARLTGMNWRSSAALGALMNTRGLMELIVLNIGLDLGVISPTLFAMMVLMALVTTLMTTPVVLALRPEYKLAT
jgi:Kef-type K+ transport system membrane component KefB